MKQNHSHITLVVDRSGSMASTLNDAQGGINTFIEDQKKVAGTCSFLLFDFDDQYAQVYGPAGLSGFEKYVLAPRGSTALLDAIGRAITETGRYLASLAEDQRPEKVMFLVVTDGDENCSREFTAEQVKKLVTEHEQLWKWNFLFIGSSLTAIAKARQSYGIVNTVSTHSVGGAAGQSTYLNMSRQTKGMRSGSLESFASARIDSAGNEEEELSTTTPITRKW